MDKLLDAKELIKKIQAEMEDCQLENSDKRFYSIPISTLLELSKDIIKHSSNAWIPARNDYIHRLMDDLLKD